MLKKIKAFQLEEKEKFNMWREETREMMKHLEDNIISTVNNGNGERSRHLEQMNIFNLEAQQITAKGGNNFYLLIQKSRMLCRKMNNGKLSFR